MLIPRNRKSSEPNPDLKDKHQKIDKIYVLKRCSLFKSLSGWELSSISRLTRIVEFKKDEMVYRAGDTTTSFFVVISGRFEAYITVPDKKKTLAYLKQGAHFGEMSLLSADERHTANVRSLSDSLVLAIAKEDFQKIVESNATISLEITRVLSSRLRAHNFQAQSANLKPPPQLNMLRSDVIAVYSSHRKTGQTSFSMNLAASLRHEAGQRTVLVDMSPSGNIILGRLRINKKTDISTFKDLEKGVETVIHGHLVAHESGFEVLNLATSEAGRGAAELTTHLLNRLSVDFRFIVVDLPNTIDENVLNVMTQSDHLFLVTDNNMANVSEVQQIIRELGQDDITSAEKIKIIINEALLGFSPTRAVKKELFGKMDCFFLPTTPTMRENDEKDDPLIVLECPDLEYSKIVRHIARKLSHNLIGLALGSGAALGFAHIGVLKVLEREKIPVDMIAGSSMGSLIAAFYATGRSADELESIAAKMGKISLASKIDFSIVPIRGLIRGRRLARYFEKFLGDMAIEDTKIPLTIVGMSLKSRREVVLQSGSIVEAICASIAIPGIFHPVGIDNDTIVDGGIIDPLPIRPLIEAGANKIIAVDVLPTPNDVLEKRRYSEELERRMDAKMKNRNIVSQTLYKSRKAFKRLFIPNMFDTIVKAIQTMEHEMAETVSAEADILIRPSMPLISWTEFHKSGEIIAQGEASANLKIEDLHALVKQQTV